MSDPAFRDLRPVAVAVYGPVLLSSVGTGAVVPVIALTARDLGAGIGTAAFVVAFLGVGQMLGDLPAGALAARLGERSSLLLASGLELVGGAGCLLARNVAWLATSVLLIGVATAVFTLARQSYVAAAVPVALRARAMSTLGGVARIGQFVGPFLGGVLIWWWDIRGAYVVDMVAAVAAFVLLLSTADVTRPERKGRRAARPGRVLSAFTEQRRVFLTLGVGAAMLSAVRGVRIAIVPLAATSMGLDASHASWIVAIAGGADMLLFYPGGALMDRRGRAAVAVPSLVVMGVGMIAVGLVHGFWLLTIVAIVLGVGNGIGSGLVATLAADAAPAVDRAQFLACWRLLSDSGTALGPLAMSGIMLALPLAAAGAVVGALSFVGAGWLGRHAPGYDPTRSP